MSEKIILNAISAYKQAPISPKLLKEHSSDIIKKLMEKKGTEHYLILPQNTIETPEIEGLTIIETQDTNGFTYQNHSALQQVIKGEKPLPSNKSKNETIYTIEDLMGTENKSVFIEGSGCKPSIYTFPKEITSKEILAQCQPQKNCKGIYFGYPMGLMVSKANFDQTIKLDTDYIQLYSEEQCMLQELIKIIETFTEQTCGRCVYGYEGITQIAMILNDITLKKGSIRDISLLQDLCNQMSSQSLCEVGESAALAVATTLKEFKAEIEEHITKKQCQVAVCSKFVTYHILADQCTGCNDCVDECDEEAILGKRKFIHVIDQEECTSCGACVEACEEDAIIKAGAIKPRCPKKPIPCKRK